MRERPLRISSLARVGSAFVVRPHSHAMKDSEHKDISDPSYSIADFRVQLTGGRLRWFATVLAVASSGLFVYLLTEGDKAELDFPVYITGQAALWSVGIVF